ncbi:MAG: hypothetical protein ACOX3K_02840 [Bacilli bacterium]|jgi:hypothetical protein
MTRKRTREYLGDNQSNQKRPICTSEREELEAGRAYIQTSQNSSINIDEMLAMMDE